MNSDWLNRFREWIDGSLKRKLAAALGVGLALGSLCFLVLLVTSYRNRMLEERSVASTEINRFLQVALENAMLKRDIAGLREMVDRLGRQDRIAGVMILAPDGEVRFASSKAQVGKRYNIAAGELCPKCEKQRDGAATRSAFISDPAMGEVLRSINPVRNHEPCTQCHGKIAVNPINGILVVDYDARHIKHDTLLAAGTLSLAGLSVLLAAIGAIGWMLSRFVLAPVAQLNEATSAIARGNLGERVQLPGRDEIASLGQSFNVMARRIEGSIREVEARERNLQHMIDAMPDGVRVIDGDFKVVMANAAFASQHGRSLTDIVGRPCYATSHNRSEPCPPTLVTCPLHELQSGERALTCRHRHIAADGAERHMEISAAPLEIDGEEGERRRLVVEVSRDLSSEMHLSQEQRLSEIGFLAAGVAHEIRNPLASIQLGFASLNRELAEGRGAKAAEYVRVIEDEIGRCIDVTSRLLKLSASPSNQPELVVLNDCVADVLSLLNAEALKASVEMRIDMQPGLRVIASDSEMRMLVLNLAQNALHAMPEGGSLAVAGRRQGDWVLLAFADTGVGIAEENLSRIFDPFWSRRADGVSGTGLGLSISREIVRGAGGKISVTSQVGKGTRFEVLLPSADAEAPAA